MRVFESKVQDAAAAGAGVDAGGHGHGVRVVVDLHIVLMADVQAFEVLAHHHQVDVVETPAGHQGARRPQVGIELEFLAQAHVARAVAAARRRFQRALQRQPGAADAVQRRLRQRVAGRVHAGQAGHLRVPVERCTECVEHGQRGIDDLGADAVAGDQGGGDALRHGAGLARVGSAEHSGRGWLGPYTIHASLARQRCAQHTIGAQSGWACQRRRGDLRLNHHRGVERTLAMLERVLQAPIGNCTALRHFLRTWPI